MLVFDIFNERSGWNHYRRAENRPAGVLTSYMFGPVNRPAWFKELAAT